MDPAIEGILEFLEKRQIRATYKAIGEMLGVSARAVIPVPHYLTVGCGPAYPVRVFHRRIGVGGVAWVFRRHYLGRLRFPPSILSF